MGTNNIPPQHQDVIEWRELQDTIRAVQTKPFALPIVDADPDANSRVNLWMMYDGRVRGRNPNTGAVFQLATTTPGSSTSSPASPVDHAPESFSAEYTALGLQTYDAAGNAVAGGYGQVGGGYRTMLFFDFATIATDLAGSQISRTELLVTVLDGFNPIGVPLVVGSHDNATVPVTWSGVVDYALSEKSYQINIPSYQTISSKVAIGLRDSTVTGIVLDPRTDNPGYSGVIAGVGTNGQPPTLRVSYVK
jgi:hypothetical protein